jgi:acetyl-CoA C-acetyltransferase
MREVVIASAARTPFGRFGGGLLPLRAPELGGIAIAEAVKRSGLSPEEIEYVYMGEVLQGGVGQIPSRQASRKAGLSWNVPSITVNKVCASGLISVALAAKSIMVGDIDVAVAGGMESMSNAPHFSSSHRWGQRMGDSSLIDLMVHDGLWCPFHDRHMAAHGSTVAAEYGISREEQDEWALRSQRLAVAAMDAGKLRDEIVPVEVTVRKKSLIVDTDEGPRRDISMEVLAGLPPVFTKDGTVTAGNAPAVNDGAGALVLMSGERARQLGVRPMATIVGHAEVSEEAQYIATVPGLATNKLLAKTGLKVADVNLIEANEAFAAVALTSGRITGWNPDLVNVNGGAIAFGHPIGASGARIIMTLLYELRRRGGGIGIAAICSGGAQGDAMMFRVE